MKRIALILGNNFPELEGTIRSNINRILRFLPSIILIYTREEDGQIFNRNKYQQYEIKHSSEIDGTYKYGILLWGDDEQASLFGQLLQAEKMVTIQQSRTWVSKLFAEVREIFERDSSLLITNMVEMSRKNFLQHFYQEKEYDQLRAYLIKSEVTLYQVKDLTDIDDYSLMDKLEEFLRSEDRQFAFIYNQRFLKKAIFYQCLRKSLFNLTKFEDILYTDIPNITKNPEPLVEKIRNSFGPNLDAELIVEFLDDHERELLMVIDYQRMDESKIERVVESMERISQEFRCKMIHLLEQGQENLFDQVQFNCIKRQGKLEESQVYGSVNAKQGELDLNFLKNNQEMMELLQIPTFLNQSLKNMNKRILGYSTVLRPESYGAVLKKYFPKKGRKKYLDQLQLQIKEQLKSKNLTHLPVEGIQLQPDDVEFKASLTYIIYLLLRKEGWEVLKEELSYLQNTYEDLHLWSTTLYCGYLIREQHWAELQAYLQWHFDSEYALSVIRYNNLFGKSTYGYLINMMEANHELGDTLHKLFVQDSLIYGFYHQAALLLSKIKKYYVSEEYAKMEANRKRLYVIKKDFNKFKAVIEDHYFDLYQEYFQIAPEEIEEIIRSFEQLNPATSEFLDALDQQVAEMSLEEKLIIRDLFYRLFANGLAVIPYDQVEKIMDWYGKFCLEHNFLGDYKIMIRYLLEKLYYSDYKGTERGQQIRNDHNRLWDKVAKKLENI